MKRDMDLMRDLLLKFEATTEPYMRQGELVGDDFLNAQAIDFHINLMLLDDLLYDNGTALAPTNKGYDLLDMIREEDIWEQTKKSANDIGGFTGEVLVALAKGFIKKKLEKHTGLEIDL